MKKSQRTAKIFSALVLGALIFQCLCPINVLAESAEAKLKNYYYSDYDSYSDLLANGDKLEQQTFAEGIVMLKNENNALPLPEGSKISVFSKNSNQYKIREYLGKSGYVVNPTLANFYQDDSLSGSGMGVKPGNGQTVAGFNTGETSVDKYRDTEIKSFNEYNDAAVVIIHRLSGEGNDASRTMMWDGEQYGNWNENSTELVPGARNTDDHYLQLDQNETDMLALAAEHFDKVIVILFTPSSFETGFLDDPGHYAYQEEIKAALYIGYPVEEATKSNVLGDLMQGQINPSGRLVDTWARDFKLDPTWNNFGNYLSEVGDTKGNAYANLAAGAGNATKGSYYNNYVTYNEGIYVGYRYWETRGYTEGTGVYNSADKIHGTTTTEWENWYQAHVVYPYGYGLSYTTFDQEIVSASPDDMDNITSKTEIKIQVKVTNTGSVAGKEVVQLYYTSPYTAGGIEKAHVILAAFGKTEMLEPGESQTITLSFSARDMASYDYSDANDNEFKGYELEAGEYTVRLMKNAHEEYESVSYYVGTTEKLGTDGTTGYAVENRFDEVSNYITDDLGQKYLSRNDWEGTWPVFNYRLTASQDVIDGLDQWKAGATMDPSLDEAHPLYTTTMPTTGENSGIILSDLHGLSYDHPLWDSFLNQLTVAQLTELVTQGSYYGGINAPELGIKKKGNYDSRCGLSNRYDELSNSSIGDVILIAQTFNIVIAYEFGKQVGDEALWSDTITEGIDGIGAWYAPSINIHRSQFLGRNQQYYGEDGLLAGKMASQIVIGAQEKGLATYVKHFAVNNQETNRIGLSTWLNEQAMREVYLKGFEITVKEGKTLGIMSALNRIGTEWAGGSYNLLTEILRNEWGFDGSVVTDSYINNFSNADQMIRAGGNLALGNATLTYNLNTPTTVNILRESAHGLLYLLANSNAINSYSQDNKPVDHFIGSVLNPAVVGLNYNGSVATATISSEMFPGVSNSEIVYSLSEGSKLPAGLSLDDKGNISGVPEAEANNFRFSVKATYDGYSKTATFTISIVGGNGAIVYQINDELGTMKINQPIAISVAGASIIKPDSSDSDVLPEITYSLKSGSALPEGLQLSSNGEITGIPTKECTNYSFTVQANADGFNSVDVTFTISIHYPIAFEAITLNNGKVGVSYTAKLADATAQNKVTYTLAEGSSLPGGLKLTEGGYITGKPTQAVTDYVFTVVASAPYSDPTTSEYKITIGLNYNDLTLNAAQKGEEYFAYVNTAQGDASIKYSLKEGSELPEGLTLSEDGVISGTTKEAGVYEITIVASAEGKVSDETTVTFYVEGTVSKNIFVIIGEFFLGIFAWFAKLFGGNN